MHYWNHSQLDDETWPLFVSGVKRVLTILQPRGVKVEPSLGDSLFVTQGGTSFIFEKGKTSSKVKTEDPVFNLFIMASLCLLSSTFPTVVVTSSVSPSLWKEALKISKTVKPDCTLPV